MITKNFATKFPGSTSAYSTGFNTSKSQKPANNKSLKETAYFTLVWSQLDYCLVTMVKLELEKAVQRRAVRFGCNNYNPMDSVTTMIDQLNWQKLEHRRDNSHLCFHAL